MRQLLGLATVLLFLSACAERRIEARPDPLARFDGYVVYSLVDRRFEHVTIPPHLAERLARLSRAPA